MKKQVQSEQDVIVLITFIKEKLASLEKKMDTLISQCSTKPAEVKPFSKPVQQPIDTYRQDGKRQDNHYRERLMYKAICADCKKECEVPFRPREGRSVYCKECFSRRKSGSSFKVHIDNRPREGAPVQIALTGKPQASEKKKFAGKKKPIGKKKPVSKKRKSRI